MKNTIIVLLLLLLALSCKKKEKDLPEPSIPVTPAMQTPADTITAKHFMPLKEGNYWVYQMQTIDENNTVTGTTFDSCYVTGSSILRGKKFYHIYGGMVQGIYADSADCMINSDGYIEFKVPCNDTLYKNLWSDTGNYIHSYYIMRTDPRGIVQFNNKTYTNCITRYEHYYTNMHPTCPNRFHQKTYSLGIGVVFHSFSFINYCWRYEYRLLRYKVN